MGKVFKKIGLVLGFVVATFVVAAAGGATTYLLLDEANNTDEKLCKAEAMNECLLAGDNTESCVAEARSECD